MGRADVGRLQLRRPAGSAAGQQPADGARVARRTAGTCTSSTSARFATICSPRSRAAKRRITRRSAAGESAAGGDVASIHDRVVFKQAGLDQRLQYDRYRRKSLIDHFYPADVSLDAVAAGDYQELGDFVTGPFEAKLRRNPDRMQVQLTRDGRVGDRPVRITKGLTLEAGEQTLEDRVPARRPAAGRDASTSASSSTSPACPPASTIATSTTPAASRSASSARGSTWRTSTPSASPTNGSASTSSCESDQPMHVWTFPIETVSQSEAGFELVHQSVVVQPHWFITADRDGRWSHDDDARDRHVGRREARRRSPKSIATA